MWELDYKESWAPKNWCFWTVVLEKSLECSLDSKKIQPVHPKGNQSWIFIGRTDAEVPILWPPDAKNWLIGKDSDAGKDCRQEEKGATEDEIVGWHHRLNGYEFEQTPEDREGQRSGILQCMGSLRVGHGLGTEQQFHLSSHFRNSRTCSLAVWPPGGGVFLNRSHGICSLVSCSAFYPREGPET